MFLFDKINEIKKKPENVRLRYVWGLVAFFMTFIILIWITSLKQNFLRQTPASQKKESAQEQFKNFFPEPPPVKDVLQKTTASLEEEFKKEEERLKSNEENSNSQNSR